MCLPPSPPLWPSRVAAAASLDRDRNFGFPVAWRQQHSNGSAGGWPGGISAERACGNARSWFGRVNRHPESPVDAVVHWETTQYEPHPCRQRHRPAACVFEAWHGDRVHDQVMDQVLDRTAWLRAGRAWCSEVRRPRPLARRSPPTRGSSAGHQAPALASWHAGGCSRMACLGNLWGVEGSENSRARMPVLRAEAPTTSCFYVAWATRAASAGAVGLQCATSFGGRSGRRRGRNPD